MTESAAADLIVAVDQGTSSTKAVAVDVRGEIVGRGSVSIGQRHPRPGWVEQDADEIAGSVVDAIQLAVAGRAGRVAGLALSTQRESAVIWDRATGAALGPVLGWQDRRTADAARSLIAQGHDGAARSISGLPIDPMFSALKFAWLLDQADPERGRSAAGAIALGTVDSWLVHRLTGEFRIEAGNASRTGLLELSTLRWSEELLELFRIPRAALPPVERSDAPTGPVHGCPALPEGTRIHAVLGDSHAALFGHGVREQGTVKVTMGTGSSIMGLLATLAGTPAGLVTTVAWAQDKPVYAFEGNILSTGATLVWLSEILGVQPTELMRLAGEAQDRDAGDAGVDLVPAFAGLGAPWWDKEARAVLTGFDLGTTRADLARAGVESVCLQIEDVLAAAEADGQRFAAILLDGGPAANDWLVQLMADLSQRELRRPAVTDCSALGAAHLGGIAAGLWNDKDVLTLRRDGTVFSPRLDARRALARRRRWHTAVGMARDHDTGQRLPNLARQGDPR